MGFAVKSAAIYKSKPSSSLIKLTLLHRLAAILPEKMSLRDSRGDIHFLLEEGIEDPVGKVKVSFVHTQVQLVKYNKAWVFPCSYMFNRHSNLSNGDKPKSL